MGTWTNWFNIGDDSGGNLTFELKCYVTMDHYCLVLYTIHTILQRLLTIWGEISCLAELLGFQLLHIIERIFAWFLSLEVIVLLKNRYHGLSSSAMSNKDPCTCNQEDTRYTHVIYCSNYRSGKWPKSVICWSDPPWTLAAPVHASKPAGHWSTRDCVVIVRTAAACIRGVSIAGGKHVLCSWRDYFHRGAFLLCLGWARASPPEGQNPFVTWYCNFCLPGWYQSGLGVEVSVVSKRFLSPFNLGRCTRETECRVLDGVRALLLKENCHMPSFLGPNGAVAGVGTISIKKWQSCCDRGASALQLLCDLEINFSNITLHFSARAGVWEE